MKLNYKLVVVLFVCLFVSVIRRHKRAHIPFFWLPLSFRAVNTKTTIPKKPKPGSLSSCHPVYVDVDMELTVFLLKNVAYRFRHPRLRMMCRSRVFFILFFIALVVFPCAPEGVKTQKTFLVRQRRGGEDIAHNDGTQGGQQQDLTKSDNVDEQGAEEHPLSGRSMLTTSYSNSSVT